MREIDLTIQLNQYTSHRQAFIESVNKSVCPAFKKMAITPGGLLFKPGLMLVCFDIFLAKYTLNKPSIEPFNGAFRSD